MKLGDLFFVKNGVPSTKLEVTANRTPDKIAFVRPSITPQRILAGWVARESVKPEHVYPKWTLFVSTNGAPCYAYVSDFDFVPNSDVSVLIPKRDMTLQEKLYYAQCITMNRHKFSYGRKSKGNRLKAIVLTDLVPSLVFETPVQELGAPTESGVTKPLDVKNWKPFEFQQLFEIKKGKYLTKAKMKPGATPYIGATESRNGVTAYINQPAIHNGNAITVSYNGSIAEAFYQPIPFWASGDVNILYPKFKMTPAIGLFLCTLIRLEKYRFNYGRKWSLARMKTSIIRLPVTESGDPDWEFMEHYIKSLPYSSHIEVEKDLKVGDLERECS